ncbi:hypothetical protein D3C71_1170250 [compost metagenome]
MTQPLQGLVIELFARCRLRARLRCFDQHAGVVRGELHRAVEGGGGLGQLAQRQLRAAEQGPAIGALWILGQRLFQRLHAIFQCGGFVTGRRPLGGIRRAHQQVQRATGQPKGQHGDHEGAVLAARTQRPQYACSNGRCDHRGTQGHPKAHQRSSLLSIGSIPRLRRRTTQTSTPAPISSATGGPNQSSALRASIGGRYSTNSP